MKKRIGFAISRIGSRLWEKGGYWIEGHEYEDLTVLGKLGYKLFIAGLSIAGVTREMLDEIAEQASVERT